MIPDLEKLEKLLNGVDIKMRNDDKTYRYAIEVMDELSLKWDDLSDKTQKDINSCFNYE
jgi:hypothetical protein